MLICVMYVHVRVCVYVGGGLTGGEGIGGGCFCFVFSVNKEV